MEYPKYFRYNPTFSGISKVGADITKLYAISPINKWRNKGCPITGKTGMEVGLVRERIIVALLIYKFGEANVETEIPITEPAVDAKL